MLRPNADHGQDAVWQGLGHAHLGAVHGQWSGFPEIRGDLATPSTRAVQNGLGVIGAFGGLDRETGLCPLNAGDGRVIHDLGPIPRRRAGERWRGQPRVRRSVIGGKRRPDSGGPQYRVTVVQFGGGQFLQRQPPMHGILRKSAHVGQAVLVKDQPQVARRAEFDVASQQGFGLMPQGQRPVRQGQLRQVAPRAPNVAERRHRRLRADIPALDQAHPCPAPRQKERRRAAHQPAPDHDHIHSGPLLRFVHLSPTTRQGSKTGNRVGHKPLL